MWTLETERITTLEEGKSKTREHISYITRGPNPDLAVSWSQHTVFLDW